MNLLPFGNVALDVPGLPGFEMDFASKALEGIKGAIPFDISSCGADIGCMMDQMGAPSLDQLMLDMEGLFTIDILGKISTAINSLVPQLKCTKWVEKNVPVSNLLKQIIGKDVSSVCRMTVCRVDAAMITF